MLRIIFLRVHPNPNSLANAFSPRHFHFFSSKASGAPSVGDLRELKNHQLKLVGSLCD
jgi:hypothetical protein